MTATIPAIHALHFLSLLERWQVDTDAVFAEFGFSSQGRQSLAQPGARLSLELVQRAIQLGQTLSGERDLGFFYGLQMRLSAHGFLGFAAMTAPTGRKALELACRFAPTHTDALHLTLETGPEVSTLRIDERVPLGPAGEIIISALVIGIWQMAKAATGREFTGESEVTFAEPSGYRKRFLHLTPRPIRFGRPYNQLTIETALLDFELPLADPAAQALAREQCERELSLLAQAPSVVERVKALVEAPDGVLLGIAEVAKRLHMSERTLKRRLMEQGTSFAELLDATRRARALVLLRSPELSMEQVAERVGYTELSNFTRAFRRWMGTTPKQYRKSLG